MRALIIDDEKKARSTIRELLRLNCPEIRATLEADSVSSAVELIEREKPDLIFLDIDLRNENGFEVLEKVSDKKLNVIFVTGSDEHAVKAFKVSAIDYILKPVDPDELAAAVAQASQKLRKDMLSSKMQMLRQNMELMSQDQKRITLKTAESIHVINVQDIVFCEANRNYTTFHMLSGETILVSKPLGEYESSLPADMFLRVHQSYLVNVRQIRRYDRTNGGVLVVANEISVPVSTRKKDQLLQFLARLQ